MPALQQHYISTAYRVGVNGTVAAGKVLCFTNAATNRFVVATTANLSTYGQNPACITLEAADENNPSPEVQQVGWVPASITGLGAGAAGDICVDSSGALARGSSPDVVGQCDAEGNAMVNFAGIGVGGGGGGATPGGSIGSVQINADNVNFSGVAPGTSGNVLTSNGSAWASAAPAGIAPGTNGEVLTTAGGVTDWAQIVNANVDNAAAIAVSKLAPGSNTQVLTTSGGVATWAAPAGGFTPPTGTGFVTVTSGALDAAAATSIVASTYLTDTSIAQYDLLVANGSSRFARFAKGSNSRVLTTSSGGVVQWDQVSLTAMVTGTLPLGNGGTGLTAVPGSNTQLIYNNSGAYGATSGVTFPASNSLALGSTPATVGNLRFTNVHSAAARNAANSADQYIWSFSSSNILAIGSDSAYSTATMVSALRPCATASIDPVINGSFVGSITATSWQFGQPRLGYASPYASEGEVALSTSSATLTNTEYSRVAQNYTSGSGGTKTYPAPAGADNAYFKLIRSSAGVSTATLSIGSGTTASHTANTTGIYLFNSSGVFRVAS